MKEIPKYWYVLYKDRDEFDAINEKYDYDWDYYPEPNRYGVSNLSYHEWFDSKYENYINEAKELNAIQLSFEEWQELICGIKPISTKLNLNKLLNILKFINGYNKNKS
jgi:hypothetical protein